MEVFDKIEYVAKSNMLYYKVNVNKLIKQGNNQKELVSFNAFMDDLIKEFPDKKIELMDIKDRTIKYASDSVCNAEAQLILIGIERFFKTLDEVMYLG